MCVYVDDREKEEGFTGKAKLKSIDRLLYLLYHLLEDHVAKKGIWLIDSCYPCDDVTDLQPLS